MYIKHVIIKCGLAARCNLEVDLDRCINNKLTVFMIRSHFGKAVKMHIDEFDKWYSALSLAHYV